MSTKLIRFALQAFYIKSRSNRTPELSHIVKKAYRKGVVTMLQYYLTENLLTAAPDDYMAQTTNVRSYGKDEIAELMLKRGTTLSKADILAVLEVYYEVTLDVLSDGCAITTPIFNAQPSISGVFEGAGDSFDGGRHTVKVNFNPSARIRDVTAKIKTEKVTVAEPVPYLVEVKDTVSGAVNDKITANGVIEITGSRLKINVSNETNGIFFINSDKKEYKATVIVENKPARLIAMVPSLEQGDWTLEVRTTVSGTRNKDSKVLKIGRFARLLSV